MISSNVILGGQEGKLQAMVDTILTEDAFAFDLEGQGEFRGVAHLADISWISLASDKVTAVIPMGHPIGTKVVGTRIDPREDKNGKIRKFKLPIYEKPPPQISRANVFEILRPLFFSERLVKVTHGGPAYDFPALPKYYDGQMPWEPWEDSMVLAWLYDENVKKFGLKDRLKALLGWDYDKENIAKRVESHPFNKVSRYSYLDALGTWFLYKYYLPQVEKESPAALELERDQYSAVAAMRYHGQPVDVPRLEQHKVILSKRLVEEEAAVYKAAGTVFNINSPPQRQDVLFGKKREGGQGLKPWKETKTGWSTDRDVMESYPGNPLCEAMLTYADTNKLLNTYVLSWLGDGKDRPCQIYDGRIHTSFKQYGTVTGRYSSAEPNLQNIPRPDTEDGKLLRGAFIAPPGCKLVVADYGQIELVVLAHLIGFGRLFDGFLAGVDPHTIHAAGVLNKDPADVTKDERQKYGKTLGFTIVNGAGIKKVASMIEDTTEAAHRLLDKHEREFPEIYDFKDAAFKEVRSRKPPYLRTLIGRKRRLPGMWSSNNGIRAYSERQLFNTLIQGGAADIIKLAIPRTDVALDAVPGAYLTLTVHDELVVVSPTESAELVRGLMVEAMTGPGIQELIDVPLTVDTAIVDRWSEAK